MFGLFKPKMAPEGPVEIDMDIEIDRPASEIYPMVDFGDPRHHKAAVGTVTNTGDGQFDLVLDMMPDLTFPIREIAKSEGHTYVVECTLPEGVGRLEKTVEHTTLTPLGDERCKVSLFTVATFAPMRHKHYAQEIAMISAGCHNSLAKLKVHAEQGPEMVRAIEDAQQGR